MSEILNELLGESCVNYIERALSPDNRKDYDGDSNAPYRVEIKFAEVGRYNNDAAGFWCEVKIPRQSDNELGISIQRQVSSREDAALLFRELAIMLES